MRTIIESLGVYLPARTVSTQEVLRGCRRTILFPLEHFTGIRSRRVVAEGEYSIQLATKAVEECLALSEAGATGIDLLLCCNISRYDDRHTFSYEPSTALRLKRHFGLDDALAMDVSNACAGVFTGIYLADALLRAGGIRRALVVSGEHITHLTETAQRELKGFTDPRLACLTLGDSGVALTLERGADPEAGFHAIEIYTLGKYSGYCVGKASDRPGGGAIMLTDVSKLSAVAVDEATRHAIEVQERAGWPPELMHHLIMHQTSARTIQEAADRVNRLYGRPVCTPEKTVDNIAERGNTATTSHWVAFRDRVMSGHIRAGDNIVYSINASGLSIGTAVYKCDDLPERMRTHARRPPAGRPPRAAPPRGAVPRRLETRPVRIESIGLADDAAVRKDAVSLARAAAEQCLLASSHDRATIDLLIYAGTYRHEFLTEPAMAAIVAGEIALNAERSANGNRRSLAFDVLSGAAGVLKACRLAVQLIEAGRVSRALVVAAEVEPNAERPDAPRLGLAETGSAFVLEACPESREGFGPFTFLDFPEHVEAFRAHCDLSVPGGRLEVAADPRLEELYVECIARTVDRHLETHGPARSELRWVFAPQVSTGFLAALGERLGRSEGIVDAVRGRGDLHSSSLAFALAEARASGRVRGGDLGLVVAAGAGIQAACSVYRF